MIRQITFAAGFIIEYVLRFIARRITATIIRVNEFSLYCSGYLLHRCIFQSKLGHLEFDPEDPRYPADGILWVRHAAHGNNLLPRPFRVQNRWIVRKQTKLSPSLEFNIRAAALNLEMSPVYVEWKPDLKDANSRIIDAWERIEQHLKNHHRFNLQVH